MIFARWSVADEPAIIDNAITENTGGAEAEVGEPQAERSKFVETLESLQQRILARPTVHNRIPYEIAFKLGESATFVLTGRNLHKITSAIVTYRNDEVARRGVHIAIGKVTPTSIELTVSADKTADSGSTYTVRLFMKNNVEMPMSPYYSTFSVRHWDDRRKFRPLPPRTRDGVIEDNEDAARFPHIGR